MILLFNIHVHDRYREKELHPISLNIGQRLIESISLVFPTAGVAPVELVFWLNE